MILEILRDMNEVGIRGIMYTHPGRPYDLTVRVDKENMHRTEIIVERYRLWGVDVVYRELLPVEKMFCTKFVAMVR